MPKGVDPLPPEQVLDLSCLGCQRLEREAEPVVVLLSGQTVCSFCPAWLQETFAREMEARAVLDMADKPTRLAHLDAREARFGAEYRRRLEAAVLGLWERRRANPEAADA